MVRREEDERNGEKCRAFVAQGEERGQSQDEGRTERGPLKGTNEAMKERGRRPADVIYATFNLMYLILSGD